jgi:hypothetical protein
MATLPKDLPSLEEQEHRYASFLVYFAEQLCRLQAEALKIKATRKN